MLIANVATNRSIVTVVIDKKKRRTNAKTLERLTIRARWRNCVFPVKIMMARSTSAGYGMRLLALEKISRRLLPRHRRTDWRCRIPWSRFSVSFDESRKYISLYVYVQVTNWDAVVLCSTHLSHCNGVNINFSRISIHDHTPCVWKCDNWGMIEWSCCGV